VNEKSGRDEKMRQEIMMEAAQSIPQMVEEKK
jgi:hypothetical protein